jgi:hypothetical protein
MQILVLGVLKAERKKYQINNFSSNIRTFDNWVTMDCAVSYQEWNPRKRGALDISRHPPFFLFGMP